MDDSISIMNKIKALKNGEGIQHLVNTTFEIFGNPILTHDMEYKAIAYTENFVTDDPIWMEFLATGTVDVKWLEFYKTEEFLDSAANTKKITFLLSDKLKYRRIFGKLFNCDNIQIGAATLTETHAPFHDDILQLFECFCDVLNKEFARSEFYRDYGQEYQEILINKLLEGSIGDRAIYTAHVESIYINLKEKLYLAVADLSFCDPEHTQLVHYRDLFKRLQPDFKYSIYMDRIIIIVNSEKEVADVKECFAELDNTLKENKIYVGVSSCFENLFESNKYYYQALAALNDGMKSGSEQNIFAYISPTELSDDE